MRIIRIFPYLVFIVLVFSLPFYFTTYSYSLLVCASISSFVVETISGNSLKVIWQEIMLFILLFLAVIYYALEGSFIKDSLPPVAIYYGTPFLMLFFIRRTWRNNSEWLGLGYAYIAGCFVSAAILIFSWATGHDVSNQRFSVNGLNSNYISYSL